MPEYKTGTYDPELNYLMEISYDGTDYSGWQVQPEKDTVQGTIEKKLAYLYGTGVGINGAGRTDAGVHAIGMAASFHPPLIPPIPLETVHKAINNLLPKSIYVRKMEIVSPQFNARFDAQGKAYTYVICNSRTRNPFVYRWAWHIRDAVSMDLLRKAADNFIGEQDFSSFAVEIQKSGKNPIREITGIDIRMFGDYICITFTGKSFLYKMVRSIMGTLAMAGLGKIKPEDIRSILNDKNRLSAYDTAPPQGLFLMKVFYDRDEMDRYELKEPPFYCY